MLCVSVLLSLCGCLPIPIVQDALDELREEPQTAQEQTQAEPEEEIETLAGDGYFEPLARDELDYDEMQLGEITCEAYAPYCEAITRAAEENSQEAFHRACFEAEQMLVKIDTAASLLALESDRDATDEALAERALRQTQAYYDAADLYHQTLHEISEGEHSRLSGGEKQRVAIARMLLKNAPIVILDEATAFTDPENEDKIQRSIAALTRGKTLLVIAHRLSTIKNADNIVVLKDGAIAAEGTQEALLKTCPLYRDMWQAHIGAKHWAVSSARKEG